VKTESPQLALRAIAKTLVQLNVPFALVGGFAVSLRSQVRFTKDVDVALSMKTDTETESLVRELRVQGYEVAATLEQRKTKRLATVRLKSPNGVLVDCLAATCGIESEIVERATAAPYGKQSIPVARVEELLSMKVLSVSKTRFQDRQDILNLIDFTKQIDWVAVRNNLRLIEKRGFAREQDLIEKLKVIRRDSK
jgi:hypothetical protein